MICLAPSSVNVVNAALHCVDKDSSPSDGARMTTTSSVLVCADGPNRIVRSYRIPLGYSRIPNALTANVPSVTTTAKNAAASGFRGENEMKSAINSVGSW